MERRCIRAISLSGRWEFRFDGEDSWRSIPVPGCWEALDVSKDRPGPAWYRLQFTLPADLDGERLWLRFDGVSYACAITVNGREVGTHIGLWDAFVVEITGVVVRNGPVELLVRVEKPAAQTHGPGSPPVPGSFPLPETLCGFLPYVWGQIFGGIWQDVTLYTTGRVVFEDFSVQASVSGDIRVEADVSAPATISLAIADPHGAIVFESAQNTSGRAGFSATLPHPEPWSPRHPSLYEARLRVDDGDERTVRFGLRSIDVDGSTLYLNRRPLYLRMALSWGWYLEALHSNPGPVHVRAALERLRSLGYNGVKLCLWFPPQHYFDLADELGMLLWVELPMWLPEPTSFFRRQMPVEYERLVRLARNHPSVILYTLGCELSAGISAEILEPVYRLVKAMVGDALVRDNSGSGEAYGGLLNEFADYYDYHFYSDIQFFRGLLDYFSPRWRPSIPWLFGEFCDLDTFRDLRRLNAADGTKPWWTVSDPRRNPRGARWQFDIVDQEARLRENGLWEHGAELERISEQQALLHRKWTLETTRSYREVSGYVVTGEVDTPISTAGMWDDLGRLKFDPAEFRTFNEDLVLLVGWDKRRAWIRGGDRPAYWDTWSYIAGEAVRPHLLVSHYGSTCEHAQLTWTVDMAGGAALAQGETTTPAALEPGSLREVAIVELMAPNVETPRRATVSTSVRIGSETAANAWPLWFFPKDGWCGLADIALVDPAGRLDDLHVIVHNLGDSLDHSSTAIATAWTTEVEAFVADGGCAILLQSDGGPPGPVPVVAMPFWREAVKIIEPHPAWGDFPHDGWVGLQFFGCATDCALSTMESGREVAPILRRLDARTMRVHDYAAELIWGRGRVIVSTLRFEGGLGEQPRGIARNVAAAYLLSCWVRYLLDDS